MALGLGVLKISCLGSRVFSSPIAWRFMGSYKWGYKSLNMGYNCSYPPYNPTYN